MSILLCMLVLGLPSLLFASVYNKRFEESMPVTVLSVVLLLFVFGIVDQLRFALILSILLCSAASITGVVIMVAKRKTRIVLKQMLTPAFFVFVFLSFMIWYINRDMQLCVWDEFSHWGRAAKAMFISNKISPYTGIDLIYRSYPPAVTLFQYFVASLRGVFVEADLIRSFSIFGLIPFVPFFKNMEGKRVKTVFGTLILIFLSPMLFYNNYYASMLVDPMLAVYFGACLAEIYLYKTGDTFSFLRICLSLCMLPIIKDAGLLLAMIACSIFIAKRVHNGTLSNKTDIRFDGTIKHELRFLRYKAKLNALFAHALLMLMPLIVYGLWDLSLRIADTARVFSAHVNWITLLRIVTGSLVDYRKTVIDSFFTSLFGANLTNGPLASSFFIWVAILALLLYVLAMRKKDDNRFSIGFNTGVLAGLAVYVLSLLIAYMFKFADVEAVRVASFSRYICTYLQAVFICVTLIVVAYSLDPDEQNKAFMPLFKIMLILILTFFIPLTNITDLALRKNVERARNAREPYHIVVEKMEALHVKPGSRIWIISQNSSGFDYYVLKYEFIQCKVNPFFTWSIGEQTCEGGFWTCDITASDWEKQLFRYDYVVLYKISDIFIDKYHTLFEDGKAIFANTVYRVEKNGKKINLQRVPSE